ncbi:hypothetical protein E8E11_005662 [Didymella keratinophila]|nr:hypothetical protein E8E11_005662 [Didymella keratinophila]
MTEHGCGLLPCSSQGTIRGVKFVSQIRVFRGDNRNINSHLLFYVDTGSPYKETEEPEVAKKQDKFTRRNQGRRRVRRAVGQGDQIMLEKVRVATKAELGLVCNSCRLVHSKKMDESTRDEILIESSSLLRDRPDILTNHTEILPTSIVWKADDEPKDDNDKTDDERWCSYFKRGLSLMKAMMMDDNEVRQELGWGIIQSPWDGDMRQDLETWGYDDSDEGHRDHDYDCNFTNQGKYKLEHVFKDLSTDPRSAGEGGPNHCFYVQHSEGPAMIRDEDNQLPYNSWDQRYRVDPTEYKATGAHASIGVNPADGFLYFHNRLSAEKAAKDYWGYPPTPRELPALRSSSDISWAFWNRASAAATRTNIKYIMSCLVINPFTERTIDLMLEAVNGDIRVRPWPGTDFEFTFGPDRGAQIEGALALLGSPNGIAAGYFLLQHRQQLGRKYISKVRVFGGDDSEYPDIYMILYVSDQAPWEGPVSNVEAELRKSHAKSCRKCIKESAPLRNRKRSGMKKVENAL